MDGESPRLMADSSHGQREMSGASAGAPAGANDGWPDDAPRCQDRLSGLPDAQAVDPVTSRLATNTITPTIAPAASAVDRTALGGRRLLSRLSVDSDTLGGST